MASDDEKSVDYDRSSPVRQIKGPAERERELDELYPNRPRNHSPTLPFHTLIQETINPLRVIEDEKKPKGIIRRQTGPDGGMTKAARKTLLLERYFGRWRREVGDDIYPVIRLMVPDKDRDRAMYGLKEKVLARYLIKILQIDKNSEDAYKLVNFKAPGQSAGNFSGVCQEVISRRPFRVEAGDLTIGDVNDMLDDLAAEGKEEHQLPILSRFYQNMNAEEFMWLIRIILRQMKFGASEKTIFAAWHPDGYTLFNISSSLRRVCWDLWSPNIRLEGEDSGVSLMQCFQPQLAQNPIKTNANKKTSATKNTNAIVVSKMRATEDDNVFWIEEKLDGERMQMHMVRDNDLPGGRRFKFWSRKAKDYTYLYGNGIEDKTSSLTQYLKDAFHDGVENIILDGEMVVWDPKIDRFCPFGTLKTAALAEQKNPFAGEARPLFRIFDILLLNNTRLTPYTLRKRREALEKAVKPVHRRFEIHSYALATTAAEIDDALTKIIEEGSEGLVIKSPRSSYRMNDRNDDWIKVKPEYMKGHAATFDCLIVGGYWGSGHRGGNHSSYLCGLRADPDSDNGNKPQKFISFFKVGGGIDTVNYDRIRYETEGKWIDFDDKKPPNDWVELAGGKRLIEKPDQWIKPQDSIACEVKCAQITESDEYAAGYTLRFVRFMQLRLDRDWQNVLSMSEFLDQKDQIKKKKEKEEYEADVKREEERKNKSRKKELKVVGYGVPDTIKQDAAALRGTVFRNQTFYIMTDSTFPEKKSKQQLEEMVKQHGGRIVQTHILSNESTTSPSMQNDDELRPALLCIAESNKPRVASLRERGNVLIVKPVWLFDCISQAATDFALGMQEKPLLFEPDRHIYFIPEEDKQKLGDNVDPYGDSYGRDTSVEELRQVLSNMTDYRKSEPEHPAEVERLLEESQDGEKEMRGWIFRGLNLYFDRPSTTIANGIESPFPATAPSQNEIQMQQLRTTATFAGAALVPSLDNAKTTHIVVYPESNVAQIRKQVAQLHREGKKQIPRIVTLDWIKESWKEGTLLDAERFAP